MTSRYPGAGNTGATGDTEAYGADDGGTAAVPPRGASAVPYGAEEDWSASTRYMCAGARLDESFARRVVHELRHERYRACAPSYGVDLDRVGAHAEQTLRDLRKRDLAVGAAFVLSLLVSPVATLAYWFAISFLPGGGAQTGPAVPRRRRPREGQRDPAVMVVLRALAVQLAVLLAASWLSALVPFWPSAGPVVTFLLTLVLLVGWPWLLTWEQRNAAWRAIREQLTREAFRSSAQEPPRDPGAAGLPQSSVGGDANLVVYSGYRPFVGAGDEVTSWSFAMRLTPEGQEPGSGQEPPAVPFDTAGLVRRLADDLMGRRAEGFGYEDVTVEAAGGRVTVSLRGGNERAIASLGKPAVLVFRPVVLVEPSGGGASAPPSGPGDRSGPVPGGAEYAALDCSVPSHRVDHQQGGTRWAVACAERAESGAWAKYLLGPAALSGTEISDAEAVLDTRSTTGWQIRLTFDSGGARKFADLTGRLAAQLSPANQCAMVLDGTVLSAPLVNSAITGGTAVITGTYTRSSAGRLAAQLSGGSLPTEMRVTSVTH
ncbi:hypothetical protein PV342_15840 [Streptomyces sp. PA03-3a]|nr:hypothetical protein [Streptomyces sp. PA03-3a]